MYFLTLQSTIQESNLYFSVISKGSYEYFFCKRNKASIWNEHFRNEICVRKVCIHLVVEETISLDWRNGAYTVIGCQNGRCYEEIVGISGLNGVKVIAVKTVSIVHRHIDAID